MKLLEKFRAERGVTHSDFAKALGISRQGLYKKMRCIAEFKASEIEKAAITLTLSTEDVHDIFFADVVGKKETSKERT